MSLRSCKNKSLILVIVVVLLTSPIFIAGAIYWLTILWFYDIANKELFTGIVSALIVFALTKIIELFVAVANRKFKHLASLNIANAYLNRLSYAIRHNLTIVNARKSGIEQKLQNFFSNELEAMPVLEDYGTQFSIANLEIINKLESVRHFVSDCNRITATNNQDYGNIKKYFNELKDKFRDEDREFFCNKFVENSQNVINELERLKTDLLILSTTIAIRFDKDYVDPDIWFFNLFFPQAKDKASQEELIDKFKTKTVVEFKIDNDFSKRVTERIEGKELP
jgi:energy-coupling factor transporter transmembrane protein EcfT